MKTEEPSVEPNIFNEYVHLIKKKVITINLHHAAQDVQKKVVSVIIVFTCSMTGTGFVPEFALNYINYCCSQTLSVFNTLFSRCCQQARPLVSPNRVSMSARLRWFASSESESRMSGQLWPLQSHCCVNKQWDMTLLTASFAAVWTLNSGDYRAENALRREWMCWNTQPQQQQKFPSE